jgi:gamma-glutamylcyclotransferase (GGCT)/AIG2-like uncharacterized protein YtfP
LAEHLFVYGTLKPGQSNAHELKGLDGRWRPGSIRGRLYASGRGPAAGYPGVVLDADAGLVTGMLLTSDDLPDHWARLDAFEGDGYIRVLTEVLLDYGGRVTAYVYELRESGR